MTIPEEVLESAARAGWEATYKDADWYEDGAWDCELQDEEREEWMEHARIVVEAVLVQVGVVLDCSDGFAFYPMDEVARAGALQRSDDPGVWPVFRLRSVVEVPDRETP